MTGGTCNICASEALRLCHPAAVDYITGEAFEIWYCETCGCGRTRPSPSDLNAYYPDRYRRYSPLVAAVLRILYGLRVRRWAKQFKSAGSAFEMGCGDGLMLAMLRDLGWRVLGSERTEAAARAARERHGVEVLAGGLELVDPAQKFDLLILNQVLEHLDDPGQVVAGLASRLAPGGKLIVGVPNFGSWQARFSGAKWFHLDPPRHLHHFSLSSLGALMRNHGLEIERVSYLSPEHDPYGWVQSALNLLDRRNNRLTRLLMGIDPPDALNLLHLVLGGLLGAVTSPVSIVSWIAGRGAIVEITCRRQATA